MIHTKQERTLESLQRIRPRSGWKSPLHHSALVKAMILEGIGRKWVIRFDAAHLNKDRNEMAASMTLHHMDLLHLGSYNLAIGLLNSNSHEFRPTLFGGVSSPGKGLGIPLTKIQLGKVTKKFVLGEEVKLAWDEFEKRNQSFTWTIDKLQAEALDPKQAEVPLLKALRIGLMPGSRIGRLLKIYKGKNKWDLLLDFARMARMNPALKQMGQVHSFLYDCLGA